MTSSERHRPRKRFGQNFLVDPSVVAAIARAIAPRSDQHLVEIGPGQGALTTVLAGHCRRLTLVELDRDLIPGLEQRFGSTEGVAIIEGDALALDFASLVDSGQKLRVVGNLPYNISTPLIFHLLESADQILDMHFMLQREVVDRLAAQPGTGDWGRLGIMVQYACEVEPLLEVPPLAFNPPPRVHSAVVRLQPRPPRHPARDPACLQLVVRQAFSQRRKTLRNTLKNLFNEEQMLGLGIDPGCRAETLDLEQFVQLANLLSE